MTGLFEVTSPAVVPPWELLVAPRDGAEVDGACVEERAELRVRPPDDDASALPLTSGGGRELGALCLREGGRAGGGDGSFFACTRDDTRLFLSGLQKKKKKRSRKPQKIYVKNPNS